MTLTEYFNKSENPGPESPIAILMLRILAKDPTADYEQARVQAQRLLQKAARKNVYRVPRVLGSADRARLKARMATQAKSERTEAFQPLLAFSATYGAAI